MLTPWLSGISLTAIKALTPAIYSGAFLLFLEQTITTEAKKTSYKSIEPTENDKNIATALASHVNLNSAIFDPEKFKKETGVILSPEQFIWLAGIEYGGANRPNSFKNNILIEFAVFHHLDALNEILKNCDFKKYPSLARQTLTYKDVNQKNLLNHVCSARGVIGDILTTKIVDIYVDSLDKDTLLTAVDKFIFTLPEEQFLKIANKIGFENLAKISENKLSAKEIKKEISIYHPPQTLMKKNGYGFKKNVLVVQKIISDPDELISLIEKGFGMQITQEMSDKLKKRGFLVDERQNVFITTGDTLMGIVADRHTFQAMSQDDKIEMSNTYTNQTIFRNLLKNLRNNIKHISQNNATDPIPQTTITRQSVKSTQNEL
jgi:hypothetical protein